MATPKLSSTLHYSDSVIERLQRYKKESEILEAKYQYFISEMIMLRLFSIFEEAIAEMAYKLAAGAQYINGAYPTLFVKANTVASSRGLFLQYGRNKPIQNLKWTKAKYVKESVRYVICPNDMYIVNTQIHGAAIDEMRKIRNVLAHSTSSAKVDYKEVVRQTFGANIHITVGAFLISTKRINPCCLDKYLASAKIILHAIASGH